MLAPEAWVPLAEVGRPHGVRGEVRLRLFNRDSDLLLEIEEVLVRFRDGESQEVTIDATRRVPDAILMKLTGVDDRDRADAIRGATLCVRRSDFPPLEAGEFYVCDIEGAEVVVDDGAGGTGPVGRVRALRSYPTVDVLVVDPAAGGSGLEVPLVDSVVREVDVARGVVTLSTLEGVQKE